MRNKQTVSDYNKKYRAENPDLVRKAQKEYYDSHRDERILNARKWTLNNKERALQTRQAYMKTPKGRLTSIKGSAGTRGIEYNLLDEFALSLLSKKCHYCNGVDKVGIDRLDSDVGYLESNSVACCAMCNYMKNIYTEQQFIAQCNKISQNHI